MNDCKELIDLRDNTNGSLVLVIECCPSFNPVSRNAFQRYVRAVLNYGVKRDCLAANPVLKLDFEEIQSGETEIFGPEIVKSILLDCLENNLG